MENSKTEHPKETSIGVICLDSSFPKPVGHIRNRKTFQFPVILKVIPETSVKSLIDVKLDNLKKFMDAAKNLENLGVSAITGSCGFMALYQSQISEVVNIPVFMSSLIQIPLIYRMLKRDKEIGILTASKNSLSDEHFKAVGAHNIPISIGGMEDQREFNEVIVQGKRDNLNFKEFEQELLAVADQLISKNFRIGAIVLECTDMTCFSSLLRRRYKLPVFDLITLTQMIYNSFKL
jgi:aspartate/glutamate racemase